MVDNRVLLSGIWVALMLTYLWGDVLRILAGHVEPGKMGDFQPTQAMWLGISALMLIPIIMVVLTLIMGYPAVRWVNIGVAVFFFLFNLAGIRGYPGAYDQFLLVVSFGFNALTVWYAWQWTEV